MHKGCRRLPRAACHGLTRGACRTALLLMLASWLGGCDAAWSPPPPRAYTYTFTSKASLKTAVLAFDANAASAIATYGPIADWDVSAVTDMSDLFSGLSIFNSDISSWKTSSVTTTQGIFYVRTARALAPSLHSRALSVHSACAAVSPRSPAPRASRIASHGMPFSPGRVGVQPAAEL